MNDMMSGKNDRIIREPSILGGRLVIAGTRIPVALVLAKLTANPNLDDLLLDYPWLTLEDVKACLEFTRDGIGQRARVGAAEELELLRGVEDQIDLAVAREALSEAETEGTVTWARIKAETDLP